MALKKAYNKAASRSASWREKVFDADAIWAQVQNLLSSQSLDLPKTPRRPDIRLIIENTSGHDILFKNPGDHSNSKAERIPAEGDATAAMVMIKGETLEEQYKNAATLYSRYSLGTQGLSEEFITDLSAGKLEGLVDEAYGPAPFKGQVEKLVDVEWTSVDNKTSHIKPKKGRHAAFGARAATEEAVFLTQIPIYIKGTNTTPELIESLGMAIAVSEDWETKKASTRPIVPSVAMGYYGDYFDNIPIVTLTTEGKLAKVDLKNGTSLDVKPAAGKKASTLRIA